MELTDHVVITDSVQIECGRALTEEEYARQRVTESPLHKILKERSSDANNETRSGSSDDPGKY